MLIPLGTDRGVRRPSVVTPALILGTIAAQLAMSALEAGDRGAYERVLSALWVVGGEDFRWWQPITSTFLHGGAMHLAGNLVFLWVFGRAVEDRFGRLGFLALYVAGAYAAGGVHAGFEREWIEIAVHHDEPSAVAWIERHQLGLAGPPERGLWVYTPAVGASGAIAAVTGAFLVLFPFTTIRCFTFLGFGVVGVPAWWFIGLAIAWNLAAQSLGVDRGIAYLAHLGGYGLGFVGSMVLLWARVFPREAYDLFTVFRQAHRRRRFRAAAAAGPPRGPMVTARADPAGDELARRRAEVSGALASGDEALAGELYRALVRDFGERPGAAVLSRRAQYDLGVWFYTAGELGDAADAFTRLLGAYPEDREADEVRVLLGRVLGRLGRDDRAREVLGAVVGSEGAGEELKRLAGQELAALSEDRGGEAGDQG